MIDTLRTRLAALAAAGSLAAAVHAQPPTDPPAGTGGLTPPARQEPAAPANPAPAEPAVEKPVPPPGGPAACEPKVIRWNGGYLLMNGPEVIVRQSRPFPPPPAGEGAGGWGLPRGRSANVITGSGNGYGNTVVVDGGPGGVTVVQNARNGVGNRLILNGDDILLDLDEDLPGWVRRAGGVHPPFPGKPAPADPVVPPKGVPVEPAAPPAPGVHTPGSPEAGPKVYPGKANPFWDRKAFSEAHDCNLYWSPADKLWFRYSSDDDTYRPVAGGPEPPVK
jgi:hypothetical protein